MEMNQYILIGNILLYVLLAVKFYKGRNTVGRNASLLVVVLFLLSAICSYLYYDSPLYYNLTERKVNTLSVISLLYLALGLYIYCKPMLTYDINKKIVFSRLWKLDISYLFVFLGVCSLFPIVENLNSILHMSAADYASAYMDVRTGDFNSRVHFSSLGRFFNGICSWFQYITPVGVFFMIAQRKKWYLIFLAFLAMINPILGSMLSGGRGALFQSVCVITFNYFIFKNYFSPKLNRKIREFGVAFIVCVAAILFVFTFARAEGDNDMAFSQIYRYLGEGFVNFSETGWFVQNHTQGYSCINGTGYTFLRDVSPYFEARDYSQLGEFTRMRMYVYYTVFGDYFIDFGVFGGILFNILLGYSCYIFIKRKMNYLSSIIIVNLYAKIGFNGIYCFAYMYYAEFVLFTIICAFIMRGFENKPISNNVRSI